MSKKVVTYSLLFLFLCTYTYHFKLNFDDIAKPPSSTWGKETLISTGDLNTTPKIIKYKEFSVIAHNYGNNLKVMIVNSTGKKVKEKTLSSLNNLPKNIGLNADDNSIYLSWVESMDSINTINIITMDKDLNISNENHISNIEEKIQIGSDVMAIAYKDKIELKDFKLNKNIIVEENKPIRISGTKYKDKYIICYSGGGIYEYKYFTVENGVAEKPKTIGNITGMFRLNFVGSTVVTDGKYGYILNPYLYLGSYGGIRQLRFTLGDENNSDIKDLATENGVKGTLSDVNANLSASEAKIIASTDIRADKKRTYPNISEYTIIDGIASKPVVVSKTRSLSMRPDIYEDVAVFCDFIGDKSKVYMTSKNEEYKKLNNSNRRNEYMLALRDTSEEVLYTAVYIIVYGLLWLIPSICFASLVCLLEYKLNEKIKKIAFVVVYMFYLAIKLFFIYKVSFNMYAYFLPTYLTPILGGILVSIVSVVSCIYGYKSYTEDLEYNVIAKSISPAFMIDTFLTLMIFIPFLK